MSLTDALRSLGRNDALALRDSAQNMTGTEIIANEYRVPHFDPQRDYTGYPAGSPVQDDGQVYKLLQPYDAAHYPGRPADLPALWGLCHTTDPARAKPWVQPLGTSGMYMARECYKDDDGLVWRCLHDDTVHDAHALPEAWEEADA